MVILKTLIMARVNIEILKILRFRKFPHDLFA